MKTTKVSDKVTFVELPHDGVPSVYVENREDKTSVVTVKVFGKPDETMEITGVTTGFLKKSSDKWKEIPTVTTKPLPTAELTVARQFEIDELNMAGIEVKIPSQPTQNCCDFDLAEKIIKERRKQFENYLRIAWMDELTKLIKNRKVVLFFRQTHTFLPADSTTKVGGVFYAEFATIFLD